MGNVDDMTLVDFVQQELRIEDLVLNSDTIPGWFMAMLYFIYLLLVVFFFEDVADPQVSSPTPPEPAEGEPQEKFWKPGLLTCLLASFLSHGFASCGLFAANG